MHARATIVELPPDQLDGAIDQVRNQVIPQARELDGYQGIIALVDRETGTAVTYTLWESQEKLRASEQAANQVRSQAMDEMGGPTPAVERYEVAIWEV
jgi:hypothetical protein